MKNVIERNNGKLLTSIVVSTLAAFVGNADASMISVATGHSTAGVQASAEAYKNVVEAAVAGATAGYGTASPAVFNDISNHGLFGANSIYDIAFDFTIRFGVTPAQAGAWEFRAGTDFGLGGAVFIDGVALGFKTNDMWWAGSYGNPSQYFDYSSLLAAGNHVLQIYGLEHCCDGGQQAQFRAPGATFFTTFSSTDGLAAIPEPATFRTFGSRDGLAAIPEPATFALFGIGLLGLGAARRRKQ